MAAAVEGGVAEAAVVVLPHLLGLPHLDRLRRRALRLLHHVLPRRHRALQVVVVLLAALRELEPGQPGLVRVVVTSKQAKAAEA